MVLADAEGLTTELAYDDNGRLASVTDAAGSIEPYEYAGGRITSVVDNAGARLIVNVYDDAERMVGQVNVLGHRWRFLVHRRRSPRGHHHHRPDGQPHRARLQR